MTIVFECFDNTMYAVAYDEIINGYMHKELMIAEIDEALGGYMVRFESDWSNPIHCDSMDDAKAVILKDYTKHTPRSMKRNYYLGK